MNIRSKNTSGLRAGIALLAGCITILLASMLFATQNCYAKTVERVYEDLDATATVYDDGSGELVLHTFEDYEGINHALTSVAGTPLKEIITFNDGGYVSSIYNTRRKADFWDMIHGPINCVVKYFITGAGPKGLFNGSGYVTATTYGGTTKKVSFWSSKEHDETFSLYGKYAEHAKKFEWHS